MIRRLLRKVENTLGLNVGGNFAKKSYSQCGEDMIVRFIFDTIGISKPTYLDIGAHHPFYLNNTAFFHENGCFGVNVEPDPELFKKFLVHRKGDINLNVGVSDKESVLDFHIMNVPALNTFSKEQADEYLINKNYFVSKIEKIKVITLDHIIRHVLQGKFPDFLTIDAEGVDELIVNSIDFEKSYPVVICIETMSFSENGTGIKNNALIALIVSKGYIVYADTYINTIFILKDKWLKK